MKTVKVVNRLLRVEKANLTKQKRATEKLLKENKAKKPKENEPKKFAHSKMDFDDI